MLHFSISNGDDNAIRFFWGNGNEYIFIVTLHICAIHMYESVICLIVLRLITLISFVLI